MLTSFLERRCISDLMLSCAIGVALVGCGVEDKMESPRTDTRSQQIAAATAEESETLSQSQHEQRFLQRGHFLPTGVSITPLASTGAMTFSLHPHLPEAPDFIADHPVSTALAPNGQTLLVLTTGYNRWYTESGTIADEYIFVYDVSSGHPMETQVLTVPNSFTGIAWAPDGAHFYVMGGSDDTLIAFSEGTDGWAQSSSVALEHAAGVGLNISPEAGAVAVNASATQALVANYENDSVSLVDLVEPQVLAELDLRPGKLDPSLQGEPGGTFPAWVVFRGEHTAYVSSQRDDEVIVLHVSGGSLQVTSRIAVGSDPGKMILDRAGRRLFVANATSDDVSVISTRRNEVIETIPTTAPEFLLRGQSELHGSNPNALALSPDERTLYVTNGGTNSLAVIRLGGGHGRHPGRNTSRVVGLIPTGWYPSAVSISQDGRWLYVANAKSPSGPNPDGCRDTLSIESGSLDECRAANQYVWQLEKGGLLALPTPRARDLQRLSFGVARNNNFPVVNDHAAEHALVQHVGRKIEHVIYIIKENRTYDQVLGDLDRGDSDPNLVLFPEELTPNHHQLARDFVTLDRFFDSGETSGVGWNWTVAARTTDAVEKTQPPNYAGRGLSYDWEGTNRNINVGIGDLAARQAANPYTPDDVDILAGTSDVSSPEIDEDDDIAAYLWDAALLAGLSVRNYGCFGDLTRYFLSPDDPVFIPPEHFPHQTGNVQFYPTKQSLLDVSDPYYRGYDNKYPDYYRYKEWEREFELYVEKGELPNLQLVRLPHDHFGDFSAAIDGVNTPETQMADNDYAVGLLIEKVARSRFAESTVIFVVEDDAQNGPDHVDAHRSLMLAAGAYIKRDTLVSKPYTTVSLVRTIEDLLGLHPMGITDGHAAPMAEIFDVSRRARHWHYSARVPDVLHSTELPLPTPHHEPPNLSAVLRHRPVRTAAFWEQAMKGQNFTREDNLDAERFNRALWHGMRGESVPYPERL